MAFIGGDSSILVYVAEFYIATEFVIGGGEVGEATPSMNGTYWRG